MTLGYVGLDGQRRRTLLRFTPAPAELAADRARFELSFALRRRSTFDLAIACSRGDESLEPPGFDDAAAAAADGLERLKAGSCRVGASESRFDAWLRRSESDLHMLTTELPTGPYPYAGVPWFNTPFGRDGIITALECLWFRPELARGVLTYLAATQATEVIPAQDAEPGKMLHETRNGEMATLGEMPFGATTAAWTRPRCSSSWPEPTTSGPPTGCSPSRSGRTSRPPSPGSTTSATATGTGSSSTSDGRRTA